MISFFCIWMMHSSIKAYAFLNGDFLIPCFSLLSCSTFAAAAALSNPGGHNIAAFKFPPDKKTLLAGWLFIGEAQLDVINYSCFSFFPGSDDDGRLNNRGYYLSYMRTYTSRIFGGLFRVSRIINRN